MKVAIDNVRLPCDTFFYSEKGSIVLIVVFGNGEVEFYRLDVADPDFVVVSYDSI